METIHLNSFDGIGITPEGNFRVNRSITYNPKYYTLIASNQTQRGVIDRLKPQIKPSKTRQSNKADLDTELKALTLIDLLKKKIKTLNNNKEKLDNYTRYKDTDNIILTKRRLEKAKSLIIKYLNILKQDANFVFQRIGETCFKIVYSGNYVKATSTGNLFVRGIC